MENIITIYKGVWPRRFPKNPLRIPIMDQATICQMVQIPIPSITFDKNVTNRASTIAAIGPKYIPPIMITAVTGWKFGKEARTKRPATASAASNAINVNL